MNKKIINYLVIAILIIIDQITKMYMLQKRIVSIGIINLVYTENTGIAFGMAKNSTILITIITMLMICVLIIFAKKNNTLGVALILGGSISNLIDRLFRGFVIDYIDINKIISYPIFNIADIFIVLGAILMGIEMLRQEKKDENIQN